MYTYDVTAADMFTDRTHQFEKFGIPLDDINRVAAATTDMWADAPGGWVYEWSKLAKDYADRGDHYLASMVYGCAKFPCLTDDARVRAMQNQLDQFELASKDFPVAFERRIITVPYRDGIVEVPVHLYSADGEYAARPVLIASGGVDTWKMDIHPWWVGFHHGGGHNHPRLRSPWHRRNRDPARCARRRGDPRDSRLRPVARRRQGRSLRRVVRRKLRRDVGFGRDRRRRGRSGRSGGRFLRIREREEPAPTACTTSSAMPCTGITRPPWPNSAPVWSS